MDVTWQVADVTKPLGSVLRMMETGNRVIFEHDTARGTFGYIEHIESGTKIDIVRKGNSLIMQLWVPKMTEDQLQWFENEMADCVESPAVFTSDITDTMPVFSRLEEELI